MPNWVDNTMYVYGDADTARKLRAYMTTPKSKFDFDAVLPMPDELATSEASSKAETAWQLKYGNWTENRHDYGPGQFASREEALAAARAADSWRPTAIGSRSNPFPVVEPRSFDDLADAVQSLVIKYGFPDWHEWACATWGTKWAAVDAGWMGPARAAKRDAQQVAFFDTANGPPVPVVAELSRLFPTLILRLEYNEPSWGFHGFVALQAGEELAAKHEEYVLEEEAVRTSHSLQDLEEYPDSIYVGHGRDGDADGPAAAPSRWANPFTAAGRRHRDAAQLYRRWVAGDPVAAALLPPGEWSPPDPFDFRELVGKTLVCDCRQTDAECHATTLCALVFNSDDTPEDCSQDECDPPPR